MNSPVVMRQRWEALAFLHWRVPVELIQASLPPGFRTETFRGEAYVGLVPFLMRDVRPVGLPSFPPLSNFLETNVRTYVLGPNGESAVWFYSLDASQALACRIARWSFGLPYEFAAMEYSVVDGVHHYQAKRHAGGFASAVQVTPHGAQRTAVPGELEHFLLERYRLFSVRRGRVVRGEVRHAPYRYSDAQAIGSDELVRAALPGFSVSWPPDHAVWSPGVAVEIGRPSVL